MTRNVGLWIDHKNAYLVWPGENRIQVIASNLAPRVRSGATRIGGLYNQALDSELGHHDRYQHQLREYYENVIEALRTADRIFVMGPGEAKHELERALQKHKDLRGRLLKLEPADKMTQRQMAARVRRFFMQELAAQP
ncbi:MAG: hypothetical protein N2117_06670 [Anaerolineales bacterium]|nr:hypothetical protein [Anaerolineales bacterium]MCX7754915.1 hypothetical protein [Anaerolineales bacterium]MDW8278154.1 hypothetical protein [Anaerolineales bacterium]